jgi:glutamate N-acetyltransferase / amino-acid N-acetyltransferase
VPALTELIDSRRAAAMAHRPGPSVDQDAVSIHFGDLELYPTLTDEAGLAAASQYMKGDEIVISVDLGIANGAFTVYGCDLTDGYVRINADYTT